jgi:2-hydroxychromene-2-carboxylate isomerase
MKQSTIEFHIEELLLRDVPYEQRNRIATAVETELTRLVTEHGLPPEFATGGMIPHMSLEHIMIAAQTKPGIIGTQIAQQIYQALHTTQPNNQQHLSQSKSEQ